MNWRKNCLLWVCLAGMMATVASVLGPDFLDAVRSRFWRVVPCTIRSSGVAQEPFSSEVTHYVPNVEFAYRFKDREFKSSRFTTGRHQGSTDAQAAEQAAARFAPGATATCYVNPRRPEEAVLVRGPLWGAFMLLLPLVVVGLISHESIFAWFDRRRQRVRVEEGLPISDANEALKPDGRMMLFGLIGLTMGAFFLGFCLITPLQSWRRARHWVECDAQITRCNVNSRSGLHGPEYSLELLYEYEFAGRHLRSSRRQFGMAVDEPVADLTAWAAAHPAGTRVKCLVDPQDSTEAVLESRFSLGWVSLALGLLMSSFGLLTCVQLWHARRLRRLTGPALEEHCTGRPNFRPVQLRVRPPPWLVALGCFVAVPPFAAAGAWSLQKGVRALFNGQSDIINLLYGAGAVCVAGWCAVLCWHYARRALQPRPVLRLDPATPRVGESLRLEWQLSGARGTVAWLRLWLEGTEYAKIRHVIEGYHGPISEEKQKQEVFETLLLVHSECDSCEAGRITITLPADLMHTFRGAKCGVLWHLKTEFERGGMKLEYKFPIAILPARL